MLVLLSPRGGETGVVTYRQEAGGGLAPAHGLRGHERAQAGEPEAVAARQQRAGGGVAGANQDAEVLAALAVADGDGLAAGKVADERAQRRRQLQLVHQEELAVEHAARDADGTAGRRDVRRQAAAEVERQAGAAEPLLQEDEAAVLADEATGFVALEQQPVDEIEGGIAGIGHEHLGQHLDAGQAHGRDVGCGGRQAVAVEDQPPQAAPDERQERFGAPDIEAVQFQAEAAAGMGGEDVELAQERRQVVGQFAVEHADTAGTRPGDRKRRTAKPGRGQDELDEIRHCPSCTGDRE